MPELELHQIDRPYDRLRIITRSSVARLLSSLATEGQQTPVLVVANDQGRYVLIDGYRRVEALARLGRDTVEAVVLELDEPSALIYRHRQQRSVRSSALEEGWLLAELNQQYGFDQYELARRLGHHQSWVSRRLGLQATLPSSVQELVRNGRLSAYLAMKYLVPMARAITTDCEKIAEKIADHRVSTRQMDKLYVAWRSSDAEGRARLVERPLLFLKAAQELTTAEPPHPDAALVTDLEALDALCRRASRRLSRRSQSVEIPEALRDLFVPTRQRLKDLLKKLEEVDH
jgi:ParB family transcriptional regulator, chromosome partitioning protein